jgi:hypothetical protein
MAMAVLLRRMQRNHLTVHGFRSTFRDWTGECTNFSREVVEAALAHILKDQTEAACAGRPRREATKAHGSMGQVLLETSDARPSSEAEASAELGIRLILLGRPRVH